MSDTDLDIYICPVCGEFDHGSHTCPQTTPYREYWPEWNEGADAFSMEDSWLDRTGCVKIK